MLEGRHQLYKKPILLFAEIPKIEILGFAKKKIIIPRLNPFITSCVILYKFTLQNFETARPGNTIESSILWCQIKFIQNNKSPNLSVRDTWAAGGGWTRDTAPNTWNPWLSLVSPCLAIFLVPLCSNAAPNTASCPDQHYPGPGDRQLSTILHQCSSVLSEVSFLSI